LAFFGQSDFYVDLTDLKMSLAGVWHRQNSRHCSSGVRIWKFRNPDPIRSFFMKSISKLLYIPKVKIMDSDIESETTHSVAH